MAETMEWTGRTVEAALEAAASDLGCAPASLEYTVLEQPSRGFLGLIGRRDARIRVRDIDGAAPAETMDTDPSADMAELETRLGEEAEATGTAEKYIFVLLGHPIDECCFVYINALSCDEVAESLYSHRINSFHHGLCFFSLWQSYEKFLSIERIKRKRFLREIG